MAFDPIQEDCLRLILDHMREKQVFPLENATFIEHDMELYTQDASRLIRTDEQRSFHLVARAAELMDYKLPFITDEAEAARVDDEAVAMVREACELDPKNWDAYRMAVALDAQSNDDYLRFLIDNSDKVEEDLAARITGASDPYEREFIRDLAHRPYLRWLATIASQALIVGKYGLSLHVARQMLELDPADIADVRHTAMLAMAKLECGRDELATFAREHTPSHSVMVLTGRRRPGAKPKPDPWELIAELSLAYREMDYDGATYAIRKLLGGFSHAAEALFYQTEFPEGLFSRINVEPGSDDELVVALSEATPLFQEGMGSPDATCFSVWVSNHELVRAALEDQVSRAVATGGTEGGN